MAGTLCAASKCQDKARHAGTLWKGCDGFGCEGPLVSPAAPKQPGLSSFSGQRGEWASSARARLAGVTWTSSLAEATVNLPLTALHGAFRTPALRSSHAAQSHKKPDVPMSLTDRPSRLRGGLASRGPPRQGCLEPWGLWQPAGGPTGIPVTRGHFCFPSGSDSVCVCVPWGLGHLSFRLQQKAEA